MDLSDLHLARGPGLQWLRYLPEPYCHFTQAKTLGELVQLAPNFWRIAGRRCLCGSLVVYGNGRHSFGIRFENGCWKPDFREGVNGWAPPRHVFEAALLVNQL